MGYHGRVFFNSINPQQKLSDLPCEIRSMFKGLRDRLREAGPYRLYKGRISLPGNWQSKNTQAVIERIGI
jgi:hypothetical protein